MYLWTENLALKTSKHKQRNLIFGPLCNVYFTFSNRPHFLKGFRTFESLKNSLKLLCNIRNLIFYLRNKEFILFQTLKVVRHRFIQLHVKWFMHIWIYGRCNQALKWRKYKLYFQFHLLWYKFTEQRTFQVKSIDYFLNLEDKYPKFHFEASLQLTY